MTTTSTEERYLGNYRLLRLLGRGGQALVYLGEHRYLKRFAAIKVLRTLLDEQKEQQFSTEARLLANLSHPHIVRVLEFGIEQGTPFLVMDYAPQGSLLTLFPRGSRLTLTQVVDYTTQIASALHYAHQRHIIHRDIKPENLLLNEQQQIMISDFGLALLAPPSDELISTQGMEGTLPYMAPEQLRGKPGYASDQYALGVVAYEWLCGRRPFTGSLPEVIYQHCSVPPPGLSEKNPAVSEAIEAVILKALSKDPAQRYPDIQAFAQALAEASRASNKQMEPRSVQISGQTGPMRLSLPTLQEPRKVITAPIPVIMPSAVIPAGEMPLNVPDLQPSPLRERAREEIKPGRTQTSPTPQKTAGTTPYPSGRNQNRQRMVARVRSFWITGIFEQSLQQRELITPRLVSYPDAIANPWASILRRPQSLVSIYPDGTRAIEVYDQVDGELLILGEPGSGKTTIALELVRDLLERAERDESQPVPVVFNLSSWTQERLPLAQWLVAELNSKYQVPRRLGQQWLDRNALFPVLDGLDEVEAEQRPSCIRAINAYREEHGLRPLVVCSRSEEYFAQEERVLLRNAIVVQPFTLQQVDDYLEHAEGNFEILRKTLRTDPALQELATTPLMLSTIASAYRDRPLGELLTASSRQARQQQIFATYVEQTLNRRQPSTSYQPQQTIRWLSGLARQMIQQNQSVFYLEQIQPSWLTDRRWSMIYQWLAVRLPGFLIGLLGGIIANNLLYHSAGMGTYLLEALIGGLIGFLFSDRALQGDRKETRKEGLKGWMHIFLSRHLINGLLIGLVFWLILGQSFQQRGAPVGGLSTLFLSMVLDLPEKIKSPINVKRNILRVIGIHQEVPLQWFGIRSGAITHKGNTWQKHISNGVLVGFVSAVCNRLVEGTSQGWLVGLSYILRDGMRYGLLAALLSVLLLSDQGGIRPSEIIAWSWRRFWRFLSQREHIKNSLLVLLYMGLAYGISYGFNVGLNNGLSNGLANGVAFGIGYALSLALCYWLVLGLFQGLSSESIDNRQRIKPNEGIWRSIRNMLIIAIIGICVGMFIYIAGNTLYTSLKEGIRTPLSQALKAAAPPPSTSAGGLIVVAHKPAGTPPKKAQTTQPSKTKTSSTNGFIKGALQGWQTGLTYYWIIGLVTGLLAAFLSGGLACLRHGVLRLLLWRTRLLSLNAPHFLDYAAERILLRKVGGGYIFLHPLLRNFFASLPSEHPRHGRTTRLAGSQKSSSGNAIDGQTKLVRVL
jgi:serine/threonine protein kinase